MAVECYGDDLVLCTGLSHGDDVVSPPFYMHNGQQEIEFILLMCVISLLEFPTFKVFRLTTMLALYCDSSVAHCYYDFLVHTQCLKHFKSLSRLDWNVPVFRDM